MSMQSRCLVVAVVGLVMVPAVAQADPVDLLMKLEGKWEVDLGGMGDKQKATCEGNVIAGGKGIYTRFERPLSKGTYEAHAIWTFDPETRQVYVYEINSYGDVFEHVGNFSKDGKLRLVRYTRKGKRAVVQKTVMTFKSPDEIVSQIDEKQKGKWESFAFTFKRAGG